MEYSSSTIVCFSKSLRWDHIGVRRPFPSSLALRPQACPPCKRGLMTVTQWKSLLLLVLVLVFCWNKESRLNFTAPAMVATAFSCRRQQIRRWTARRSSLTLRPCPFNPKNIPSLKFRTFNFFEFCEQPPPPSIQPVEIESIQVASSTTLI